MNGACTCLHHRNRGLVFNLRTFELYGHGDLFSQCTRIWSIDGSYGTADNCVAAYHSDLDGLQGLKQNSADFLQTQAGECVRSTDPRLSK